MVRDPGEGEREDGVVDDLPGGGPFIRFVVPSIFIIQGCQNQECSRICALDDVLDRVRTLYDSRNVYRCFSFMVPILL